MDNTSKVTVPVTGMSCAACAANIERTLRKQDGVLSADVNYAASTVRIEMDTDRCSVPDLAAAVREIGYDMLYGAEEDREVPAFDEAEMIRKEKYAGLKRNAVGALAVSAVLMAAGMLFADVPWMKYVLFFLSTPVVFWFGRGFFSNAWKQLRHGSANMDTLVASSTGIAWLFSVFNMLFPQVWTSRGIEPHVYFESSAMIVAFILLGRLLESRAKNSTASAIGKLYGLRPKTVLLSTPEGVRRARISEIRPGDLIVVKPGDRIAVDGSVSDGESHVDESMLTGEPVAVPKKPGDKVYAGTVNQKGAFRMRASEVGEDTVLSGIIRMVQDAQGSKAHVQRLVDRISAVFVPSIMLVAVISFLGWVFLAPENGVSHGVLALVTVLIIACPCALGLATPTAIMVGIGKGAENGILIRDAETLEIAKNIDTVVLDKTGTLTYGHPHVTDILWNGDVEDRDGMASVLYRLEQMSEHPLSDAVADFLREKHGADRDLAQVLSSFSAVPGYGIEGMAGEEEYFVGNAAFMERKGVEIPVRMRSVADSWAGEVRTVIWFASRTGVIASMAVEDSLKSTSVSAVSELKSMGIDVVMLTGDNERVAGAVAAKTGIGHYESGVLPEDKAGFVRRLQAEGRKVAMVGDGINDSAALALADLSIAMGRGSDIAMDSSMVTLLTSDLMKIPQTLKLSEMTVRTIKQNLFWAFFYNAASIPVAAGVLYPLCGFLLNPMIGGAAMAFSSVSVVSNSLRLRRKKLTATQNKKVMKRYKVEGMMCNHCRMHVEKALNGIEGVTARVSLEPPVAEVEFSGKELPLETIRKVVSEEAGDYTVSEM